MAKTDFSDFSVETPQQVLQRLQLQRQQGMASNNPLLVQQSVIAQSLDNLFGNAEYKRAQQIQTKIKSALDAVPADGPILDTQMAQLKATRDALVDVGDLQGASKVNLQMLQLGNMMLEQRKLQADVQRTEGMEQRDTELHPLNWQEKYGDANEWEPWMNPYNGDMTAVHEADTQEQDNLSKRGYVPAGKPTLQGSKADVTGLTKPVVTDLQTAVVAARAQQNNLRAAMAKYDPSFTQYATQLGFGITRLGEKIDLDLVPVEAKERFGQYVGWRRNTRDALNLYIKSITGAQMSKYEIERITGAFPHEDNSHSEFMENIREVMGLALAAEKRASLALRMGLQLEKPDDWQQLGGLDQYKVSAAEIDAALGIAEGGSSPAGVNPSSAEAQEIIRRARERVRQ